MIAVLSAGMGRSIARVGASLRTAGLGRGHHGDLARLRRDELGRRTTLREVQVRRALDAAPRRFEELPHPRLRDAGHRHQQLGGARGRRTARSLSRSAARRRPVASARELHHAVAEGARGVPSARGPVLGGPAGARGGLGPCATALARALPPP